MCKTILPVADSPMSPPPIRGGCLKTPLIRPTKTKFRASYQIQNTTPYQSSEGRYTVCMVCGRSVDFIKREKVDWYKRQSTPANEPEYFTRLRREAYENGLNASSFLFLAPAVSQAAACDGTTMTTSAEGQRIMPGTLPTF